MSNSNKGLVGVAIFLFLTPVLLAMFYWLHGPAYGEGFGWEVWTIIVAFVALSLTEFATLAICGGKRLAHLARILMVLAITGTFGCLTTALNAAFVALGWASGQWSTGPIFWFSQALFWVYWVPPMLAFLLRQAQKDTDKESSDRS